MTITGIVKKIFDTENITDSFSKRRIVVDVTDNPKYPNPVTFIAFDGLKTKICEGLSEYKEGDHIKINFNL